jgi:hypothetical protein
VVVVEADNTLVGVLQVGPGFGGVGQGMGCLALHGGREAGGGVSGDGLVESDVAATAAGGGGEQSEDGGPAGAGAGLEARCGRSSASTTSSSGRSSPNAARSTTSAAAPPTRSSAITLPASTPLPSRPPARATQPDGIRARRWWTLPELRATHETVYPIGLADLITDILDQGIPQRPVVLTG